MSGYFQRLAVRSGLQSVAAPLPVSPLEVNTVREVAAPASIDAPVPARPPEQAHPAAPRNRSPELPAPIAPRANGQPIGAPKIQRQTDSASSEASQRPPAAMPGVSESHSTEIAEPVGHTPPTAITAPAVMPPLTHGRSSIEADQEPAEPALAMFRTVEVQLDQRPKATRADDAPAASTTLDSAHVNHSASPFSSAQPTPASSAAKSPAMAPAVAVTMQQRPAIASSAPASRPTPIRRSAATPSVRIGQVQVDVHAPAPPPPAPVLVSPRSAAPATPPPGPALRRFYLRSW